MSILCVELSCQYRLDSRHGTVLMQFPSAPVDFPYGTVLFLRAKYSYEPTYIYSQTPTVPAPGADRLGLPRNVPAMLNVTVTDGVYKAVVYVPTCPRQLNSFEVLLGGEDRKALISLVSATLMAAKENA